MNTDSLIEKIEALSKPSIYAAEVVDKSEVIDIIRSHTAAPDLEELVFLVTSYIDYIKEFSPKLHKEADGLPSVEDAVKTAIKAMGAPVHKTNTEVVLGDTPGCEQKRNPPPNQTSEISVIDEDALFRELLKLGYSDKAALAKVEETKRFLSLVSTKSKPVSGGVCHCLACRGEKPHKDKREEQPVELSLPDDVRNRINRIISGCMIRGLSSEATTDEVWEYIRLNAPKVHSAQLAAILKRLEFVEDKPIGVWQRGDNSGYQTWNDGEYEISKAAKELRRIICNS